MARMRQHQLGKPVVSHAAVARCGDVVQPVHVMDLPFHLENSSTGAQECSDMPAAISRGADNHAGNCWAGTYHRRPDFIMVCRAISRLGIGEETGVGRIVVATLRRGDG